MKVVAGVIVDGYYSKDSGIVSRWIPSCGYFGGGGRCKKPIEENEDNGLVWLSYFKSKTQESVV